MSETTAKSLLRGNTRRNVALGAAPSAYRHAGKAAALDPQSMAVARLRQAPSC